MKLENSFIIPVAKPRDTIARERGIPILGVTTGLHEDYHKASDEPDKIDYHKMKRVTVFAFMTANKIANQKKRIVIDNPVSQEK